MCLPARLSHLSSSNALVYETDEKILSQVEKMVLYNGRMWIEQCVFFYNLQLLMKLVYFYYIYLYCFLVSMVDKT
jgi:hypothetical protein